MSNESFLVLSCHQDNILCDHTVKCIAVYRHNTNVTEGGWKVRII